MQIRAPWPFRFAVFASSAAVAALASGCGDASETAPGPSGGANGPVVHCVDNAEPLPTRPAPSPATLPALHVEGTDVLDDSGARVALRGVNFGSWLQVETWINGIGTIDGDALPGMLDEKAEQLGLSELLAAAMGPHVVDLLKDSISDKIIVERIRADSYALATAEQKAALDELWGWFDSIPWIFEEESLWKYLEGRFDRDRAEQLRTALVEHWIGEDDARRVSELGLNLIRVPIWYRALDDEGRPAPAWREAGWSKLHEVLEWARKYELYVLLDLHGAPGGQSAAEHAGLADGNHLWDEPACLQKTETIWTGLATWFRDDPHVAGYDLLNEPMGPPDAERYRDVHDALYRAIRSVDPRGIVWIEDAYLPDSMRVSPSEMGWENAGYQVHIYTDGSNADEYEAGFVDELLGVGEERSRYDCPLFIGEFSTQTGDSWAPEGMGRVFGRMNAAGIHWAPWTWKFRTQDSTWGLYAPQAPTSIDVKDGSFEEILTAFEAFDTTHYEPNPDYAAALAEAATAPALALDYDALAQP